MPTLTRWYVKASFIYLSLALVVGVLAAWNPPGAVALQGRLFPLYIHFLIFGWLSQLIFGVVFWMFPKHSREKPRGSERLGWLTHVSLGALLLANKGIPFQPLLWLTLPPHTGAGPRRGV